MQTRLGFTLMTLAEFDGWVRSQQVARTVLMLQEHHTLSPSYGSFNGRNHFELQSGMKQYHVVHNGWGEIGQHFTTFPDGTIMTGRSLEQSPACIKGNNQNSLCIENLGNFDQGRDALTADHRATVIGMVAIICKRFAIPVNTDRVVYHHWFHLDTGARTDGSGNTKSCPGTAFFGGNTVENAQRSFLPLVRRTMGGAEAAVPAPAPAGMRYACVQVDRLNVRAAPAGTAPKINTVTLGSVLRVHNERDGWLKISSSQEEWVSAKLTQSVERATVNADTLNVRNGPAPTFDKLAALARKQELFVYERQGDWCRIGLEQRWVAEKFLTLG